MFTGEDIHIMITGLSYRESPTNIEYEYYDSDDKEHVIKAIEAVDASFLYLNEKLGGIKYIIAICTPDVLCKPMYEHDGSKITAYRRFELLVEKTNKNTGIFKIEIDDDRPRICEYSKQINSCLDTIMKENGYPSNKALKLNVDITSGLRNSSMLTTIYSKLAGLKGHTIESVIYSRFRFGSSGHPIYFINEMYNYFTILDGISELKTTGRSTSLLNYFDKTHFSDITGKKIYSMFNSMDIFYNYIQRCDYAKARQAYVNAKNKLSELRADKDCIMEHEINMKDELSAVKGDYHIIFDLLDEIDTGFFGQKEELYCDDLLNIVRWCVRFDLLLQAVILCEAQVLKRLRDGGDERDNLNDIFFDLIHFNNIENTAQVNNAYPNNGRSSTSIHLQHFTQRYFQSGYIINNTPEIYLLTNVMSRYIDSHAVNTAICRKLKNFTSAVVSENRNQINQHLSTAKTPVIRNTMEHIMDFIRMFGDKDALVEFIGSKKQYFPAAVPDNNGCFEDYNSLFSFFINKIFDPHVAHGEPSGRRRELIHFINSTFDKPEWENIKPRSNSVFDSNNFYFSAYRIESEIPIELYNIDGDMQKVRQCMAVFYDGYKDPNIYKIDLKLKHNPHILPKDFDEYMAAQDRMNDENTKAFFNAAKHFYIIKKYRNAGAHSGEDIFSVDDNNMQYYYKMLTKRYNEISKGYGRIIRSDSFSKYSVDDMASVICNYLDEMNIIYNNFYENNNYHHIISVTNSR